MESGYPFSTERSSLLGTETFRDSLGTSLNQTTKSVIILSAYLTIPGLTWLKEKIKDKKIKCTIVTRWNNSDLAKGSSDIECYSLAKKNGWTFKVLKDLHAKVMLVDYDILFIGSPNLTGRGMSLVPVSNQEIGVKLKAVDQDLKIINKLVEDAALVDDNIYQILKDWKKNLPKIQKPKIPNFPKIVENSFKEKFNQLWVSNFPWCNIEYLLKNSELKEDAIVHDLELFGLADVKKTDLEKELKESFLQSKIFNWLIKKLKAEEDKEIYFGRLSSIIHDGLVDDPMPYRKNVKILQTNLYSFLKYFKDLDLVVDVPKSKSERIRLLKD